jgi:hypothetical protein
MAGGALAADVWTAVISGGVTSPAHAPSRSKMVNASFVGPEDATMALAHFCEDGPHHAHSCRNKEEPNVVVLRRCAPECEYLWLIFHATSPFRPSRREPSSHVRED